MMKPNSKFKNLTLFTLKPFFVSLTFTILIIYLLFFTGSVALAQTCPDGTPCTPPNTCLETFDPLTGTSTGYMCLPPIGTGSGPIIQLPQPTGLKITQSAGLPAQIINLLFIPIVFILGFIAIYYMVLASIRLIISRGEPEKVAEARSRLIYAVVGFIVLLLAFASLEFVEQVFLRIKR